MNDITSLTLEHLPLHYYSSIQFNTMKFKKIFILIASISLIVGATSCAKCKVCTKPGAAETRFCEKDYSSSTEYGLVIDIATAQGFTCKRSI